MRGAAAAAPRILLECLGLAAAVIGAAATIGARLMHSDRAQPAGLEPQLVTTLCYSWTQSHGGDSAVDRGASEFQQKYRDHGGQLQPTFRAEYGGLLRCRRCSRCLPASGQAGHRLGGCQVAWGARELRRRRPSQTPQWTPGRVPSAALPEAAAAFPSGLIVHVVVFCAGMNVSVVRSAGGGRWSNPPSPPGASRVRGGVLHRIYDEYGSQKARHTRFLALFQPQLTCPQHRNTQS